MTPRERAQDWEIKYQGLRGHSDKLEKDMALNITLINQYKVQVTISCPCIFFGKGRERPLPFSRPL